MRLVIVESPYAGDVEANVEYARAALRDCLLRGEAPIATHLLVLGWLVLHGWWLGLLTDRVSALAKRDRKGAS